ncbi:hypothetical protein D9611_001069 [Ephemerocybe angulata]|uniref:Pentatricopeptide repeat-containing protein n=1 Tax=Ephemerocybe angulata TaxID=980116 RepID=A0A8H5F7F3_9AGAR|nr:hypothetical protein D9611_001069 [Tulosesus angulatus]
MASRAATKLRRGFSTYHRLRNVESESNSSTPAIFNPPSVPEIRGRRRPMIGTMQLRQKRDPAVALHELNERIHALEEVAEVEEEEAVREEAYYSERDLASFYEDVLASPFEGEAELKVNDQAMRAAQAAEDALLVQAMYERFDVDGAPSTSTADNTLQKPIQLILSRLESIVSRLESAQRISSAEEPTEEQTYFPVSILTMRECEALVRVSAKAGDAQSAELTLQLMKRTGLPIPEAAFTSILKLYARTGDPASADRFISTFLASTPTSSQRHFHIQAHLTSTPSTLIPLSALDLIHAYENRNTPAPMETYNATISALLHRPSSIARAQAWDLFSHMRYVAHPDPSVPLYTTMIKACAYPLKSSLASEPEKAVDLWTEMTVDHGLTPTVASYNAVILACARSGTKEFVGEAFRIATQMLDSHRDAEGRSAYRPDRKTFCALLEGAKRLGDLARVRWILAEMTRRREGEWLEEEGERVNAPVDAEVDEEVMVHVFNAYAAYNPPFVKAKTVVLKDNSPVAKARAQGTDATPTSPDHTAKADEADASTTTSTDIVDDAPVAFAHVPPQTHGEVIQEVEFLFDSIKESQHSASPASNPQAKFRSVQITPRLVTAYLSVFYNHAPLQTSYALFRSIFEDVGITTRPVRAYVELLERLANARKTRDGSERRLALAFAEEVWAEWAALEAGGVHADEHPSENGKGMGMGKGMGKRRIDARTIERANVALVRVYVLNHQPDKAMDIIRAFAARYPPQAVRVPPPKPMIRSTKMMLGTGDTRITRPLVRMTGATEVGDDYVPPVLMWRDVEALHHKLVACGKTKDIKYLGWVTKAYEWALRVRRDEAMRCVPRAAGEGRKVRAIEAGDGTAAT